MVATREIATFQKTIWAYYKKNGRFSLPWRKTSDPYKILVSEMMLQQTQVGRVIPKYTEFLKRFPSIKILAQASLSDVLKAWQGLGYNRRAKFLHLLAKEVVQSYKGKLPSTETELLKLPGIGRATASALMAFAFNKPTVYLETNVRSVFLFHFFKDSDAVGDDQLLLFVERAASEQDPRTWNWALLDYGSHIKSAHGNPNLRSKHYTRQSKFEGSDRQLRGQILQLLAWGNKTERGMASIVSVGSRKMKQVLAGLLMDGLVSKRGPLYSIG